MSAEFRHEYAPQPMPARNYLATGFAAQMVAIGEGRLQDTPVAQLAFLQATAESLAAREQQFDVVLGFNYLHLVHDLPGTLAAIHMLLRLGGVFVSKTPCLVDMSPVIRLAIPLMRRVGKTPFVQIFTASELAQSLELQGFAVMAIERHTEKGRDTRPFIHARRR